MAGTDVVGPDVYHGNVDLVPAKSIAADPRFGFVVIKATEGVAYPWAESWFPDNWKAIGATRLVRGAYHFLVVGQPGKQQAQFLLQTVQAQGGFRDTDMHPVVDVEWKLNDGATAAQVTECVEEFAATIHAEGLKVIRYGRSMFLDLGITSATGCDFAWVPRYNDELGSTAEIGFPKPDLWQYGNGTFNFTSWPDGAPGMRPGDMSVVLTDLDRLTVGGSAPALGAGAASGGGRRGGAGRRGPLASLSDEDWEALAAHLPRPSDDDRQVQQYALGQLDRRFNRPIPAEQGPRRAGWRHEDDLIQVRKAMGKGE